MRYLTLFAVISLQLSAFSQTKYTQKLTQYRSQYLPEKVFIHTDKQVYAAGETLWLSSYLVDGQTHKLGAFSTFIRLELRNSQQEPIQEVKLFSPEGRSQASLTLPADLLPGTYQLLAYTSYQRNSGEEYLFQKTIQVVSGLQATNMEESGESTSYIPAALGESQIEVQFFPEGGDCVGGLPCQLALTAMDAQGTPRIVEGSISSSDEPSSQFFKTNAQGMGIVGFTPQAGKIYYAEIEDKKYLYKLPEILAEGYTLQVLNQPAQFQLVIRTNILNGLEGSTIVVHHRGIPYLEEELNLKGQATLISIPKEDMAPGVYVATVFTPSGEPMAERLFFSAPEASNTELRIELGPGVYQKRAEVELAVSLPELSAGVDSLDGADLSMSIVPSIANGKELEDIRTWLLLNSDVNLPLVEARSLLFEQAPNVRDQLINQWLMTRGWRRFRWQEISSPEAEPPFPLERGIYISGKMSKKEKKDVPQPGKVYLSILEDNLFEEATTNEQGEFSFGPYLLFDTTDVILQGRFKLGKKGKNNLEKIDLKDNTQANLSLDKELSRPELSFPTFPTKAREPSSTIEAYTTLSQNVLAIAKNFDSLLIQLDEVEITAKRISQAEKRRNDLAFYGTPTRRMVVDSIPGGRDLPFVRDLLIRMPGVTQVGGEIRVGGPTSFQGNQSPLLLVDGVPVPWDYLANISVRDVEFIDLLKGPDASIFGARGGNNVILIYTRLTSYLTDQSTPGLLRFSHIGFHKAREFAVFDSTDPKNTDRPDLRTTLHWNPHIAVKGNSAHTEFFETSDQAGSFTAIVQGIRKNGQVLWGSKQFEVK
ncbi:MAG: MG2 domain-containing protein [Bacteroidota bacterium]